MIRLVVLVGLPGSGKSVLATTFSDYLSFDDFIDTYDKGDLTETLTNKIKVVVSDPRLCIFSTFSRFMPWFLQFLLPEEIQVIVFANDPKSCIKNVFRREPIDSIRLLIISNIIDYSSQYNLQDYASWSPLEIPVYEENWKKESQQNDVILGKNLAILARISNWPISGCSFHDDTIFNIYYQGEEYKLTFPTYGDCCNSVSLRIIDSILDGYLTGSPDILSGRFLRDVEQVEYSFLPNETINMLVFHLDNQEKYSLEVIHDTNGYYSAYIEMILQKLD